MTYEIYYNDEVVYSPELVPHGYGLFSPKVTLELNKAGSLKFIMSMKHPMYGKLYKMRGIVTVLKDGEEIFRGRVLSDKRDFYNNKEIVVEGELAFLNDILVEPYDEPNGILRSEFFRRLIQQYTNQCSPERVIYPGELHLEKPNENFYGMNESWPTVISEMIDKLVDDEKETGYLILRRSGGKSYLDYYDKLDGRICEQQIKFGVNLLSLEDYLDASEIYTRVIPLGANDDDGMPIDITSVNDGKNYIENPDGIAQFGIITATKSYSNIKKPDDLKKEAEKFLEEGPILMNTLTVKAADLHDFDDSIETFKIGYYVNVRSEPHHLDTKMLLSKVVLDLQDPSKNEYTFGRTIKKLTETQVKASQEAALTIVKSQQAEQGIRKLIVDVRDAAKSATNYLAYDGEALTLSAEDLSSYAKITNESIGIYNGSASCEIKADGFYLSGTRNGQALWTNPDINKSMSKGYVASCIGLRNYKMFAILFYGHPTMANDGIGCNIYPYETGLTMALKAIVARTDEGVGVYGRDFTIGDDRLVFSNGYSAYARRSSSLTADFNYTSPNNDAAVPWKIIGIV